MAVRYIHVILAAFLLKDVFAATAQPPFNATTTATTSTTISNAVRNCEFMLLDTKIRDALLEALALGSKLVKFRIKFKGYPHDILNLEGGNMFRPNDWFRSTNKQGQSLLMLDDNFEVLSLSLLGIGVTTMDVELEDKPHGCMTDLTSAQRIDKTRQLLLHNLEIPNPGEKSDGLDKNERICYMQIESLDGWAHFVYHCCHSDPDGYEICEDIERDVWINVLLICIIVIKVLVVLYSPTFIPETFYRKKFTAAEYIHKIPEGKRQKKINVVKTKYPAHYTSPNPIVRLQTLEDLTEFKKVVDDMHAEKTYDVKLDSIHLSAKSRKLLSENYVPVSIVKMIYENVFRCKMRTIPALKPCCDTGVCGILEVGCKVVTWYKCLRVFAKLILVGLLAIPWILRLVIYFTYEKVTSEEKRLASEKLGISMNFSGSFTLYLTPLHGLFMATYIIVTIDSFAYGLLGKTMKYRFRFILRKCLRDMRERSRLDAYSWSVGLCILPFKKCGLFGCLLAPLYWVFLIPCILPILAFYTFPALNLSIRLIIHLFIFMCPSNVFARMFNLKERLRLREIGHEEFQGKENLSKREVCMQLIIILMCLTSFWSLTFLLMECLSFFVEVGVYTLMGIIVNAGATLQYVTLLFLIFMYANSSFGGVSKMYLDYHKIIRGLLLQRKHEEMKVAARKEEHTQENTVFRVQSSINAADTSSGISVEVKEGKLRWGTSGLLVFLDSMDQPFTPANFFFETINMNYCGCPGKLWENTLAAFYNFMKIMVFLVFVVIVVLAFGNQFSTTNQMLATLAGGFIPFVFRNFFMKGGGSFTVDTESVQFVTEFDNAVAAYKQKWPVSDIKPVSVTESGLATEVPVEAESVLVEKDATADLSDHQDGKEAGSPLMESTTVNMNGDIESEDSEIDSDNVDLIISLSKLDHHNRPLRREGSLENIGSMSMLENNTALSLKPNSVSGKVMDV